MSLLAGDKLGPDEIIALLGQGGLGEVYRAHDAVTKFAVSARSLPNDR